MRFLLHYHPNTFLGLGIVANKKKHQFISYHAFCCRGERIILVRVILLSDSEIIHYTQVYSGAKNSSWIERLWAAPRWMVYLYQTEASGCACRAKAAAPTVVVLIYQYLTVFSKEIPGWQPGRLLQVTAGMERSMNKLWRRGGVLMAPMIPHPTCANLGQAWICTCFRVVMRSSQSFDR